MLFDEKAVDEDGAVVVKARLIRGGLGCELCDDVLGWIPENSDLNPGQVRCLSTAVRKWLFSNNFKENQLSICQTTKAISDRTDKILVSDRFVIMSEAGLHDDHPQQQLSDSVVGNEPVRDSEVTSCPPHSSNSASEKFVTGRYVSATDFVARLRIVLDVEFSSFVQQIKKAVSEVDAAVEQQWRLDDIARIGWDKTTTFRSSKQASEDCAHREDDGEVHVHERSTISGRPTSASSKIPAPGPVDTSKNSERQRTLLEKKHGRFEIILTRFLQATAESDLVKSFKQLEWIATEETLNQIRSAVLAYFRDELVTRVEEAYFECVGGGGRARPKQCQASGQGGPAPGDPDFILKQASKRQALVSWRSDDLESLRVVSRVTRLVSIMKRKIENFSRFFDVTSKRRPDVTYSVLASLADRAKRRLRAQAKVDKTKANLAALQKMTREEFLDYLPAPGIFSPVSMMFPLPHHSADGIKLFHLLVEESPASPRHEDRHRSSPQMLRHATAPIGAVACLNICGELL